VKRGCDEVMNEISDDETCGNLHHPGTLVSLQLLVKKISDVQEMNNSHSGIAKKPITDTPLR